MLLTDTFTFIHQPKTGGTFVTAVLTRLHEARGDRVLTVWFDPLNPTPLPEVTPGTVVKLMLTTRNQHGRRADIPVGHVNKPVLTGVRTPYDRYVSQFEFAWWRRYPQMFGPGWPLRFTRRRTGGPTGRSVRLRGRRAGLGLPAFAAFAAFAASRPRSLVASPTVSR